MVKIEQAADLYNQRKSDPANQLVQDMVDMIKAQDLEICPKLLAGLSEYQESQPGEVKERRVTVEENIDRRNYRESDNIDYVDGDLESSIYYEDVEHEGNPMYDWGTVSYTHLRAHETVLDLVCRLLLEKKKSSHCITPICLDNIISTNQSCDHMRVLHEH